MYVFKNFYFQSDYLTFLVNWTLNLQTEIVLVVDVYILVCKSMYIVYFRWKGMCTCMRTPFSNASTALKNTEPPLKATAMKGTKQTEKYATQLTLNGSTHTRDKQGRRVLLEAAQDSRTTSAAPGAQRGFLPFLPTWFYHGAKRMCVVSAYLSIDCVLVF